MSNFLIRKVAVLGAGVMGAQIAAHLVNARVPVLLFDLPAKEGPKNAIALKAIENLKKLSPAPFGVKDDAKYLEAANYEDDIAKLAECDVVIEAIAERMDWKHDLYKKVAPHIAPNAIFATNTSGLSITKLSEGFSDELKARFCGVHFFNPPRYMHLVELIPTAHTRPEILDQLETFLTSVVGKGVVRAKDTPNFIANRVGIFSILAVITEAAKFGLRFDEVDDLTGSRLGRAKSATFRTADVVGLDTMAHVIKTMQDNLADDPFFPVYQTPAVLAELVKQGALGQKTGGGFYKKEGKAIKVLDAKTGAYVDSGAKADETVGRILKRPPAERLKLLRETNHPHAQFLWSIFRDVFHYIGVHLESIADNARDVDLAIRWGFGWNEGPFEGWQAAGWKQVAEWVQEDIAAGKALANVPLPSWVLEGPVAEKGGVHTAEGSWAPASKRFVPRSDLAVYRKQVFRAPLIGEAGADPKTYGKTLFETDAVRAWVDDRAGEDDVVIVSFKSKMNTIGPSVIDGLVQAIELAEKDYKGVVIWQPTSLKLGTPGGPFSAGANLEEAMPAFMMGGAKGIEPFVKKFQEGMLRVKYANVPVVAAVSGIALGGGCELMLHCDAIVAHAELAAGLPETKVGIVPGWGGCTQLLLRGHERAKDVDDPVSIATMALETIFAGNPSSSALDAWAKGLLRSADGIVMNRDHLIGAAIQRAASMANAGYYVPDRSTIVLSGLSGKRMLMGLVEQRRETLRLTETDMAVAETLAAVLTGASSRSGAASEEDVLALEREAVITLAKMPATRERIEHMLATGKPLRN